MAERDVIFRIGKQEYGFDVQNVTAIEPISDITMVPNAPECIQGLMNLRGDVIPVYSLRKRFGLDEYHMEASSKFIVAKYNKKPIAFCVDEVLEMTDFAADKVTPPPVITQNERTAFIRAVANNNGRLILLLDPAKMYEGDEEARMDQVLESLSE